MNTLNENSFLIVSGFIVAFIVIVLLKLDGGSNWKWGILVIAIASLSFLQLSLSSNSSSLQKPQDFTSLVGAGDKLVVSFHSNRWLGCLSAKPLLDRLENDLGDKARFIRIDINTDSGREIKANYDIELVPAVLIFDEKGNIVWRQTGTQPNSVSITQIIDS